MHWSAAALAVAALCLLSSKPSHAAGVRHDVDDLDTRVTNTETVLEAAFEEIRELLDLIRQATPGRLCATTCVADDMSQLSFTAAGGTCVAQVNHSCQPYRCVDPPGTCRTQCGSDADCAASHRCVSGECLLRPAYCTDDPNNLTPGPGRYVVTSDRRVINCLPYKCGEFGCLQTCQNNFDCYTGWICNSSGNCVPPSVP